MMCYSQCLTVARGLGCLGDEKSVAFGKVWAEKAWKFLEGFGEEGEKKVCLKLMEGKVEHMELLEGKGDEETSEKPSKKMRKK